MTVTRRSQTIKMEAGRKPASRSERAKRRAARRGGAQLLPHTGPAKRKSQAIKRRDHVANKVMASADAGLEEAEDTAAAAVIVAVTEAAAAAVDNAHVQLPPAEEALAVTVADATPDPKSPKYDAIIPTDAAATVAPAPLSPGAPAFPGAVLTDDVKACAEASAAGSISLQHLTAGIDNAQVRRRVGAAGGPARLSWAAPTAAQPPPLALFTNRGC